jgi:acetyl esterase/lipase
MSSALTKKTYVFKRASDIDIKLDVHVPSSTGSSKKLPIFYWIHGGGNVQGRRQAVPPHMKAAASRLGFAIVSPDYRLAPQARLPAILEDLADSFRFTIEQLPGRLEKEEKILLDAENVIVSGSSVGGFDALHVALGMCPTLSLSQSSDLLRRVKAIPIIYPITTFDAPFFKDAQEPFMGYLSEKDMEDPAFKTFIDPSAPVVANTDSTESDVSPLRNKLYMYAQQTAPKSGFQQLVFGEELIAQGWLEKSDCVKFVAKEAEAIKKTVNGGKGVEIYIVHGDADKAVAYSQATDFVEAAKANGIDAQLERLDGIDQ